MRVVASTTRLSCQDATTKTSSTPTSIVSLGKADQLSAKFFFSNSNQNVPFSGATVPGFPALRDFDNRNLAIAHTHIFSPQAVNQFRAGFSRIASRSSAPGPLTAQSVGISRVNDAQVRSLPHIQVLGAFQLGNAVNDKDRDSEQQFLSFRYVSFVARQAQSSFWN